MKTSKSLKALAVVFFLSGIWDIVGGMVYSFFLSPFFTAIPLHRFYALFIGSFFLCFAYLQILSSFNIRRYLFLVGCVFIGRILYIILLYAYILGIPGFPKDFWITGVVDLIWSILYIVIALTSKDIGLKDLFLPKWRES